MEGYLGRVIRSRSKVKVKGVKKCPLGLSINSREPSAWTCRKKKLRNTSCRNTTWGVFKAFAFFFIIILFFYIYCLIRNVY